MVRSSAMLRLVSLRPPLILFTSSNCSFCSWLRLCIYSFSWKNSMPIRFSIRFWFSSSASTRIDSLDRFSLSSPSRLARLKERGDPAFFLVEIRFLLRFSLMSREEVTLLTVAGAAILDYAPLCCWHFSRKLSSISTSFWFSMRKERSDIILSAGVAGQAKAIKSKEVVIRAYGWQEGKIMVVLRQYKRSVIEVGDGMIVQYVWIQNEQMNQWKHVTWDAVHEVVAALQGPFQTSTSPTDRLYPGKLASFIVQLSRLIVCNPWLVFTVTLFPPFTFVTVPNPEYEGDEEDREDEEDEDDEEDEEDEDEEEDEDDEEEDEEEEVLWAEAGERIRSGQLDLKLDPLAKLQSLLSVENPLRALKSRPDPYAASRQRLIESIELI